MTTLRDKIREAATPTAAQPKVAAPANDKPKAEPKVAREPKPKAEPHPCNCKVPGENGCNDAVTKGVFAPGHDAKLVGHLTREVVAGSVSREDALKDLEAKGGSKLLVTKLDSAIKRETAKAERKAQAERQKAEAKAEKERKLQEAREQAAKAKEDLKAKSQS